MAEALYQPFPLGGSGRAQIWRYSPAYRRPRHFHVEPELNLICSGRGSFAFGDRVVEVAAGDLLWWSPGQDHELVETSADFDLFVIGTTPEFSERVLGPQSGVETATSRSSVSPDTLRRWREACSVPLVGAEPVWAERHVGDLWRQADELRRHVSDRHALTRRGLERLRAEPDLDRAELARASRTDPSEVSRYFRRDTGLTFTAYRTRLRLLRFIDAVDAGAPSLLSAASRAGFGSYSQCHRAFFSTFGLTPRLFFGSARRAQMADTFAPW